LSLGVAGDLDLPFTGGANLLRRAFKVLVASLRDFFLNHRRCLMICSGAYGCHVRNSRGGGFWGVVLDSMSPPPPHSWLFSFLFFFHFFVCQAVRSRCAVSWTFNSA